MRNKQIAEIFRRMGTILEMRGENVFKIRAYFKAADNIENLSEDIKTLKDEGRLSELPGIGKALEEKIIEYLDEGKIGTYEKLTKEIPETIFDVIDIPSVGPKKAKLFFDELKIKTPQELLNAAENGKLNNLPGIKEKTIENIIKGIKVVQQGNERMLINIADEIADIFVAKLKILKEAKKIDIAGSLRRRKETIKDIDILVESSSPQKVMAHFVSLPEVKQVLGKGETKSSILTHDNVQVDIRVIEPEFYGAALLYFTGSQSFNVKIRHIAKLKGQKVSEYGIFSVKGISEKRLAGKTEEECLDVLGFPYIPPELREDIGENVIFDKEGFQAPGLIKEKDVKADLHMHTNFSDGSCSIEEMAKAAIKKGYSYMGLSDHSQKLRVANGIQEEDLKKVRKEIDRLNKKFNGFRILFGTELEVDSKGELDYSDEILSGFDYVIAAIHIAHEQPRDKMTSRIVKACKNKYVNMIAHPSGILRGRREAYDFDLKEVCNAAADANTALEINSFPNRLDLDSYGAFFAKNQGVKFVVNTDSHSTEHLDFMKYGIGVARRAWLTKKDVLNTLSCPDFIKAIKK